MGAGGPRHNNYYKMTGHLLVKNLISYKMSFYKAPNPTHFIREIQRGIENPRNPQESTILFFFNKKNLTENFKKSLKKRKANPKNNPKSPGPSHQARSDRLMIWRLGPWRAWSGGEGEVYCFWCLFFSCSKMLCFRCFSMGVLILQGDLSCFFHMFFLCFFCCFSKGLVLSFTVYRFSNKSESTYNMLLNINYLLVRIFARVLSVHWGVHDFKSLMLAARCCPRSSFPLRLWLSWDFGS